MAEAPDNFDQLRETGIIRTDELPEDYRAVVDSLEPAQVQVMLDVWERLQAAGPAGQPDVGPGEPPEWVNYMFF